jgi:hypothetical protein
MRRIEIALVVIALAGFTAAARAAEEVASPAAPAEPPPAAAPAEEPPAAPPSPPAQEQARPTPAAPAQNGQWMYTQQYGWVWAPYGDAYSYVPPSGEGEPYEYVYAPASGWTWVVAPWVWGFGPWPYFAYGPAHFGWYVHGWWRSPWRWHYHPGFAGRGRGPAPAPYRAWGRGPRAAPAPQRGYAPRTETRSAPVGRGFVGGTGHAGGGWRGGRVGPR